MKVAKEVPSGVAGPMGAAHPSPRRAMKLKALLSIGLLTGLGAVSTLAAWTGEATATSSISAGTVAIGVGALGESVSVDYPLDMGTNWYPGLSKATMITVKNTGTLAAPYTVSADAGAGELGRAMTVKITTGSMLDSSTCGEPLVLQKDAGFVSAQAAGTPTLDAGKVQNLCVEYSLPVNAPNSLQGKSATITLTFTSTLGTS